MAEQEAMVMNMLLPVEPQVAVAVAAVAEEPQVGIVLTLKVAALGYWDKAAMAQAVLHQAELPMTVAPVVVVVDNYTEGEGVNGLRVEPSLGQ
jgi:hypothetical protein